MKGASIPMASKVYFTNFRCEGNENLLQKFRRLCETAGVMAEVRKREHYEKPSVKRKKKAEAARKRRY